MAFQKYLQIEELYSNYSDMPGAECPGPDQVVRRLRGDNLDILCPGQLATCTCHVRESGARSLVR